MTTQQVVAFNGNTALVSALSGAVDAYEKAEAADASQEANGRGGKQMHDPAAVVHVLTPGQSRSATRVRNERRGQRGCAREIHNQISAPS